MAITKKLRDEADRTIAGIMHYYEQCDDAVTSAAERELRIGKVEDALEGCNGITEKEKIQKTAENLFVLTCAWERDSLALKQELKLSREETEKAFKKFQEETIGEFNKLSTNVDALGNKIDAMLIAKKSIPRHAGDNMSEKVSMPSRVTLKVLELIDHHPMAVTILTMFVMAILLFGGKLGDLTSLIASK